ncbi:U2 small nuclear ribonucleoprotein A'-like [Ischnura elegans]|uniref:U2 small nuclear ribonucleoprotein A'-like n=1 Tax=Ischnura elegans TaxID=197161 RepID=UPI001ED8687B|nr:U2 small nuclear ribonucleoprotein A'-like [Ischnura elegans]
MVKLTPELIQQSLQYINPVKDRELDLRGYKIPVIENLGATLDQFDTIDFSDNDIRKLDGFPLLKRLKCLLLNNNRIVRIAESLETTLPNLESLILTGNSIQELADIDPLATLKKLTTLSLLHNPVTTQPHYRLYVAFKLPNLRLLDFRKIKMKEREEANTLFKSKRGKEMQREMAKKAKTFVPGAGLSDTPKPSGPAQEDVRKIREAIARASSLEEVERLNRLLKAGLVPGRGGQRRAIENAQKGEDFGRMEEDDESAEMADSGGRNGE